MLKSLVAVVSGLVLLPIAQAQVYNVDLDPGPSAASWSFAVNSPLQLGGASFILGDYDATTNPTGTRTIPGLFGGDTNANTPVPLTGGGITTSASSGSTPLSPAGSFQIRIDPEAGECVLSALSIDLLNGATAGGGATASIRYNSFRTRQPTCTVLGGITIPVPLGSIDVTTLILSQENEEDAGTLTDAGGGAYTFGVPMVVIATIEAELNGTPSPLDPIPVPLVLTGTITPAGETANVTLSVQVNETSTEPGPFEVGTIPFAEPLCGGSLLLTLVLASIETTVTVDATLVGAGTRVGGCDPDFNLDGNVDQDDLACLAQVVAGNNACSPVDPDFNRDGNVDQDDLDALAQVVAGAPCP
jgi:hypothetical protein